MPRVDPTKPWLEQSRKSWVILAQGAAWVLGAIGGFLLPPPVGLAGTDDKTWLRFAQFFVAILIGLVFFGVLKWKQKKHAKGWWLAAAACLLLATAAFFNYQRLMAAWTGNYEEQRVVIGSVYTPQGRAYAEKNPDLALDLLLGDFLGRAEDIWTRESINRRRLILAGIYVSCLPLFTVCLVAVIQAIQCLKSAKARKRSG